MSAKIFVFPERREVLVPGTELPVAVGAEFDVIDAVAKARPTGDTDVDVINLSDYRERRKPPGPAESYDALVGLAVTAAGVVQEKAAGFYVKNVADNPEVKGLIDDAHQEGRQISGRKMRENIALLEQNREEDIAPPTDVLGTARRVVSLKKEHGEESQEYKTARMGLWYDKQRRLQEARTRKTWDIFDPLEQRLVDGELVAFGLSVDQMHINGINPNSPAEDEARQVNDFVRLHVNKNFLKNPGGGKRSTFGIWECPQFARDAYHANPNAAYQFGDYVPQIDKMMIVVDALDPQKGTLTHEQIAVPGILIDHEVVVDVYRSLGLVAQDANPTRLETHAIIGEASTDLRALDILKALDTAASKKHGFTVFMGEKLEDGEEADYEKAIELSAKRKDELNAVTDELVDYVEEMAEAEHDVRLAAAREDAFVKERLLKLGMRDPDQAEIMFDKATAEGLRDVVRLGSQGRYEEAGKLLLEVERAAPPAGGCGAGACGLESLTALELQDAKTLLEAGNEMNMVRDTERACRSCGSKSVVYAWTDSEVRKGCTSCRATENVSSPKKADES